jgi:hypothetical protein
MFLSVIFSRTSLILGFWLIAIQPTAFAAETPPNDLQQRFETRYQSFLAPNSQSLLPFLKMELPAWKTLLASGSLKPIFGLPDVFYNNKTYVFTLYQAADGQYYLDAKGGFWGMDELI